MTGKDEECTVDKNDKKDISGIRKNKGIIIIILLVIIALIYIVVDTLYQEHNSKNNIENNIENNTTTYEDKTSKNFYLQEGKLFVLDSNNNKTIQVPGDFSQMNMSDYEEGTYQSNTSLGNIYFYYTLDNRIYLVMSKNTNFDDWTTKELTSKTVGIFSGSKIKYIRISGNYGYIFSVSPEGIGKIIKSTTEGEYWSEIKTSFALDDNCTLRFLNEFGMAVDGFLTIPSVDGKKCDLYRVNNMSEATFEKIDVNGVSDGDKVFTYYGMPQFLDETGMVIVMEAKENKDDANVIRFVSTDEGITWKTEDEYQNQKNQEEESYNEFINRYNKMVENLDKSIYVTNFEDYSVHSNEVKLSEKRAKEIAEIGFKESASRIAGEGIEDTEKETIEIQEVTANNYFTRKYNESDNVYTSIKRKAYVATKINNMGNGVKVYVDATTGLIIGGAAFGD